MGSKEAKRISLFVDIAGILAHQLPEGVDIAVLLDLIQRIVAVLIQTCCQNCNNHILSAAAVQTAEHSHNIRMQLQGLLIIPANPA